MANPFLKEEYFGIGHDENCSLYSQEKQTLDKAGIKRDEYFKSTKQENKDNNQDN